MACTEGGSSSSFEALMRQLRMQHEDEVNELRAEITRLQHAAADRGEVGSVSASVDCIVDPLPATSVASAVLVTPSASSVAQDPSPLALPETLPDALPDTRSEGILSDTQQDPQFVGPEGVQITPTSLANRKKGKAHTKRSNILSHYAAKNGPAGNPAPTICGIPLAKETLEKGPFEVFIGVIIIFNVIFVYLQLEFAGFEAGVKLGLETGTLPDYAGTFQILSHLFTTFFVIELIVKLSFLRTEFFFKEGVVEKFNIFDTIIVVLTVVDMWILSPLQNTEGAGNLTVVRMVRFIRVFRALRVVRTFELFSKLRVLVTTVTASFFALFWSMVLLTIVMVMGALVLSQMLNATLMDNETDEATADWIYRYYGTPSRSLWSFFELTFSGGWPNYVRPLVEEVTALYGIFFFIYIAGVTFAMFRIITALFLKDTLSVAAMDTEMTIAEKMKEKNLYAQKLLDFFEAADTSGDGVLTIDEFEDILKDERVMTYLSTLELDVQQTRHLFDMLDDGDQKVSVEEFVKGAVRLKGQARSQDVVAIMHDFAKVMRQLHVMEGQLKQVHKSVVSK